MALPVRITIGDKTELRIQQTALLDGPLADLRYVSAKRLAGLERLGLRTVDDLLSHYPFRYNDFSQVVPILEASLTERSTVLGSIHEIKLKRPRARLTIVEITLVDDSGMCIISLFNQPWLARQLKPGQQLICQGQMELNYSYRRMASPLMSVTEPGSDRIQPVYRVNSDISQGWMRRLVDEAFQACAGLLDPLPPSLRIRHALLDKRTAIRLTHHPESLDESRQARRRLAFEEVFFLQLYMLQRKSRTAAESKAFKLAGDGPLVRALPGLLPFDLTSDQQAAVSEILADLASGQTMDRLLSGDVGSGKTVVALHALLAAVDGGAQAAMMAPTEVLAKQYASQLGPLLDRLGVGWALLTSSTTAAERGLMLGALSGGGIGIIFGTHALIEPDVGFARLALVVIDEQHRFGVRQREALRSKSEHAHHLAMTATPIPRSLALTVYGDQEVSYIRSRPRANAHIETKLISRGQIGMAYDAIRAALARGEQAYIVCPLIGQATAGEAEDEADKSAAGEIGTDPGDADSPAGLDGEDSPAGLDGDGSQSELFSEYDILPPEDLHAAERERQILQRQVFPEHRVSLLTSRLPAAKKQEVMDAFRDGRIDVLVSTTVIEVGVDVPNATVMIIQDADRFGLSQLHQLRGRVGRGSQDGQVFLVSASGSAEAQSRLRLMQEHSDGFLLAEADLRLRQEGDILGLRQHGRGSLKLVQVIRDSQMIQVAHNEVVALLAADPGLEEPEHALLAGELERLAVAWQEPADDASPGAGSRGQEPADIPPVAGSRGQEPS